MYTYPYYLYPYTVGEQNTNTLTFQSMVKKVVPWVAVTLVGILAIWFYMRVFYTHQHVKRTMRQRDAIIYLGYLKVAGKAMTGPEAQKWVNEQLASMSSMYEDEVFDPESFQLGDSVFDVK